MSETPFFKTRMGHAYYDSTMPALVKAIERLAAALERPGKLDQAADDLLDAVDELLDTEIVPGSERTRAAFAELRARAKKLREVRCRT